MNKKIVLVVVLIMLVVILLCFRVKNVDGKFNIHFFDAGKADSCIITIDDNVVMIDTGEYNLSDRILEYLSNNNIDKIDYLIVTHFDKDHVGSASTIIDNVDVLNVLSSNVFKDSDYYDAYINSLNNKRISAVIVSDNYFFDINGVRFDVNGPGIIYDKNSSNNSSLIVSVYYGSNSFLFMGDAQNDRIEDFIESNNNKYDFIKMPYHGNYQKKLDDLLENVMPRYAVVSTSSSVFDDKILDLFSKFRVKYYVTFNGDIDVIFDSNNIYIEQ